MKNIGKPCAGKPHARFDEGGLPQGSFLLYLYYDIYPIKVDYCHGSNTQT